MRKAARLAALLLLSTLAISTTARAAPVSFDWGSVSFGGSADFGVYEADGVTPLQPGDLVQLIATGADGLADPPQQDGTPGGDDQLLDTSAVEQGTLPGFLQGKGYVLYQTYSYDSDVLPPDTTVYIRAWNGPSIAGSDAYGDSVIVPLDGDSWSAPRWSTGSDVPTSVSISNLSSRGRPLGIALAAALGVAAAFTTLAGILRRRRAPGSSLHAEAQGNG